MKGLKILSKEISGVKLGNKLAVNVALAEAGQYAKKAFVDDIFKRYNISSRERAASAIKLKITKAYVSVSAKHKTINAYSYVKSPVHRASKNKRTPGKRVIAAYNVSYLRGKITYRPAFIKFVGLNGNVLLGERPEGNKARGIPRTAIGPSIAGAFGVVKDQTTPSIMKFLNKSYLDALK